MSSRELWTTAGIAVVAVALIALLGAGLLASGGAGTVTESPVPAGGIPDPPADGSSGVVMGVAQVSGGLKLLGIQFRSPRYAAFISMIAPEECIVKSGNGGREVLDTGVCASLPASGTISGGGITSQGHSLTIVEVSIEERCYQALSIGSAWPSELAECFESHG